MSSPTRPRFTEQQYRDIERKAEFKSEFVNGEMFAMAGGTANHSRIHVNLAREISSRLEGAGCEMFNSEFRVKVLATGLETYPDASVVCGEVQFVDRVRDSFTNPVVLIEVLSPTTEAWDRGGKWHHYQQIPTLREYILISQHQAKAERYVRHTDGLWLLASYTGLDAELPIDAAGISIPLRAVYRSVTFEEDSRPGR